MEEPKKKIKDFIWLVYQDRLQTGVNLRKKEWKGSKKCCLCGETTYHIFFNWPIARIIWFCFKEALGWDRIPISMKVISDSWIPLGAEIAK